MNAYVYICVYDINPNPDNISVPGGRALERVGMNPSCEFGTGSE